ncbi:MAG: hypothetical protein ACLGXA_19515 [Acidobacteriota bacterium]
MDKATPAAERPRPSRGGGLRGLLWAVLLEAAALSLLAFLIYEWRALHL